MKRSRGEYSRWWIKPFVCMYSQLFLSASYILELTLFWANFLLHTLLQMFTLDLQTLFPSLLIYPTSCMKLYALNRLSFLYWNLMPNVVGIVQIQHSQIVQRLLDWLNSKSSTSYFYHVTCLRRETQFNCNGPYPCTSILRHHQIHLCSSLAEPCFIRFVHDLSFRHELEEYQNRLIP